jgi:hypothetical protein
MFKLYRNVTEYIFIDTIDHIMSYCNLFKYIVMNITLGSIFHELLSTIIYIQHHIQLKTSIDSGMQRYLQYISYFSSLRTMFTNTYL